MTGRYPHLVSMVRSMDWNTGLSSAASTRMGGAEKGTASGWIAAAAMLIVKGFLHVCISAGRSGILRWMACKGQENSESVGQTGDNHRISTTPVCV